ncbi:MAG: hypothetical protein LUD68_08610 [Rikenellaceae bacterium]|nr:hypothetical protein [Rikenellaceae bacterium]
MKNKYILSVFLLALVSLTRCDSGYRALDTTVSVDARLQYNQGGDSVQVEGWQAWYFEHTDPITYYVENLEQALRGIFKSTEGQETHSAQPVEVDGPEPILFKNIPARSAMLLVVHPETQVYAYRQMDFTDGLDTMWIRLPFPLWQTSDSVVVNKWNVILRHRSDTGGDGGDGDGDGDGGDDDEAEEADYANGYPSYRVDTYVVTEGEEGLKDTLRVRTVRGYYYAVPDEQYTVLSLEDAVQGVVSSTREGQPGPEGELIRAKRNTTDGYVRFTGLDPQLKILVLFDEANRLYAYRFYREPDGDESVVNLYFQLDAQEDYEDKSWFIFIERQQAEGPAEE